MGSENPDVSTRGIFQWSELDMETTNPLSWSKSFRREDRVVPLGALEVLERFSQRSVPAPSGRPRTLEGVRFSVGQGPPWPAHERDRPPLSSSRPCPPTGLDPPPTMGR
ncbi:MAG: hypothetical protein MZV70_77220 [Desulfobacterales bacterium]|nr:hypothetical protein [Desulfobacterales bacterium]